MNNESNKQSSKFPGFNAGKGFYIALALCLAVIGISGYFLVDSLSADEEVAPGEPVSVVAVGEVEAVGEAEAAVAVMAESDIDAAAAEAASQAAASIRIWPLSGGVSREYNVEALAYDVTTGDWRTHDCTDMAGYLGEPVMAVTAGTVTAVYDDDLYGTTVEIAHEGSVSTRYGNLGSVPTVAAGDSVAAGDVIGAVGDTAIAECAQEPHLHLQVFREGVAIDPREYIEG